jgi:phage protein D
MQTTKLIEESEAFGDFYVPRFEVKAGGQGLPQAVVRDVIQVTYKDNIKEIDSFEVTVNNWSAETRTFRYIGSETTKSLGALTDEAQLYRMFEPCAREFELFMGYGSTLTRMVKGTCTTLEPSFPQGSAPILTVRALNVLHKLRRKKKQRSFANQTPSQIAKKVGADLPIPVEVKPRQPEQQLDYIAQTDQFDIDFLVLLARSVGYVVYVGQRPSKDRKKLQDFLYFGVSDGANAAQRAVTYQLEWGLSLMDFKPTLSTANQAKSVEVRGWDRDKNKAIRAKVDLHDKDIKVNKDLIGIIDRSDCQPREDVVVNEPMRTPAQAKQRALALLGDKLKELVVAEGTTIGLPDLRAGQRVKIVGVGARFSGVYFVTESTHTIDEKGYITKFKARREEPEAGAP